VIGRIREDEGGNARIARPLAKHLPDRFLPERMAVRKALPRREERWLIQDFNACVVARHEPEIQLGNVPDTVAGPNQFSKGMRNIGARRPANHQLTLTGRAPPVGSVEKCSVRRQVVGGRDRRATGEGGDRFLACGDHDPRGSLKFSSDQKPPVDRPT
jgi:hypothetical protein